MATTRSVHTLYKPVKPIIVPFNVSIGTNVRAFSSKPTIEMAKEAPKEFYEMSNDMVIKLAAEGVFDAM